MVRCSVTFEGALTLTRKEEMRKINTILFDMGCTLIEFEPRPWPELVSESIAATYDELVRMKDGSLPDRSEFIEGYNGQWREARDASIAKCKEVVLGDFLLELCSSFGIDLSGREVSQLVEAHYRPVAEQISLYHDTKDSLEALRDRGIRMGIISNTIWPAEFHEADLKRFGIDGFFDVTVFSSAVGYRKPHPAIFEIALNKLGATPEETAYVGDYPERDIVGAQNAGLLSVLKRHPNRKRPDDIVPDITIRNLSQLLARF